MQKNNNKWNASPHSGSFWYHNNCFVFCFQTWLFKPWLLNPAMTNWTECFLQAHHYIFGCNSGTNIKALFFMKILCIFIQTRFWHNLIKCLFWSQYQTHSTVTTTYINRKCTLWIIVFVSTHFIYKKSLPTGHKPVQISIFVP